MIIEQVGTENPHHHWKHIECDGKVVLDLGCGRWEKTEYRDKNWPTTPEFFIEKGATKVYAIDIDPEEITWFTENVSTSRPEIIPLLKDISSTDSLNHIYTELKPNVVKCDIEHNEFYLLGMSDELFSSVEYYAIETHSPSLENLFIEKFKSLNYDLVAVIELTHAHPMKVLFAKKGSNVL